MKTIWKYKLQPRSNRLIFPKGFEILSTDRQGSDIFIWVFLDSSKSPTVHKDIWVAATGERLPLDIQRFIGTVSIPEESLVWHVFVRAD